MGRGESLGRQLKRARVARGMTQSEAARAIQAQQSAISMFERGESSALGLDRVKRLAELLGVSLAPADLGGLPEERAVAFCEELECPSHVRRLVGARLVVQPTFVPQAGDGTARCATCLSPLERRCPRCESDLREGLQCPACAAPYFTPLEFDDAATARRHFLRGLAAADPQIAREHPEYLLFDDEPLELRTEVEEPERASGARAGRTTREDAGSEA